MADLSITAAQVVASTSAGVIFETAFAGEAITQGQAVYRKAADGKFYKAQADGTSAEAEVVGIAISAAGVANQKCTVQTNGTITLGAGAAPAQGTPYFVSGTAGGICLDADIASASYVTYLGVGGATNTLILGIQASGGTHV